MRRKAAGELAELVGPATTKLDRRIRVHRFRSVARRAVESATPEGRALLEAYASGVNAGLAALRVRPFEYLLLQSRPAPWKARSRRVASRTADRGVAKPHRGRTPVSFCALRSTCSGGNASDLRSVNRPKPVITRNFTLE